MTQFYKHLHHDILIEPLTEPIENRIAYIRANKPADEIEIRLRLMQPVRRDLPAHVVQAGAALERAWAPYEQPWAAYEQAREAYKQALRDETPALEALHAQECPDCPWNGHSIFPEKANEQAIE